MNLHASERDAAQAGSALHAPLGLKERGTSERRLISRLCDAANTCFAWDAGLIVATPSALVPFRSRRPHRAPGSDAPGSAFRRAVPPLGIA